MRGTIQGHREEEPELFVNDTNRQADPCAIFEESPRSRGCFLDLLLLALASFFGGFMGLACISIAAWIPIRLGFHQVSLVEHLVRWVLGFWSAGTVLGALWYLRVMRAYRQKGKKGPDLKIRRYEHYTPGDTR